MGKNKYIEIENKKDLLIAKLDDKIRQCRTKNKIVNTEFLNINEKKVIEKKLYEYKEKNYIFLGGYEEAESKLLVLFPEKFLEDIVYKNINNIIKCIKIILPNELKNKYTHRDYLGAVINLGIEKNRIGDIIVHENGADILIISENSNFIKDNLQSMSKFKKAKITIENIENIQIEEKKFEQFTILVNSMRLDNFVSEITKFSRSKTEEWINTEKVYVNDICENKISKQIKQGDILSIRTSGKYIVGEIIGKNVKGKTKVNIKKYA